jgi:glutamate-1-semialdehyde 2,1-aminomutase
MVTVFFTDHAVVRNYAEAKSSDTARFGRWFRAMLEQGIYWPPSQFEAAFLSAVMSDEDIDTLLQAASAAFRAC